MESFFLILTMDDFVYRLELKTINPGLVRGLFQNLNLVLIKRNLLVLYRKKSTCFLPDDNGLRLIYGFHDQILIF